MPLDHLVITDRKVLVDHVLESVKRAEVENSILKADEYRRFEQISDRWRTNNMIAVSDFEWVERIYEDYC